MSYQFGSPSGPTAGASYLDADGVGSWLETGAQAWEIGANALSGGSSSSLNKDQTRMLEYGLPENVVGPLALRADFADGTFNGKTITDWDTGGSTGAEQRQFFRELAVRVGVIDSGYAARTGGMEAARLAFRKYAQFLDSSLGTNLASFISASTKDEGKTSFPQQFVTAFMAIPLANLAALNDKMLGGTGVPGDGFAPLPETLGTTATPAGERLQSEWAAWWESIKAAAGNIVRGTVEGATTGARTTAEGAAAGSGAAKWLMNPLVIVGVILALILAARYLKRAG